MGKFLLMGQKIKRFFSRYFSLKICLAISIGNGEKKLNFLLEYIDFFINQISRQLELSKIWNFVELCVIYKVSTSKNQLRL